MGLLIWSETIKVSSCECSKPKPTNECWKQIVKAVQADGNNGRELFGFPPHECCPELRTYGVHCYWLWINVENGHFGAYDPELVLFNGWDIWNDCQS